ncbi:pyridoxal-dependent decarboxylase [Pseudogemmatithrix spongiicola]|uniref:Pyridoxal-dependent decarboxylase n=1 Tax=Pseudogemmatithrix spongiicola TaxID=3062599 RepID=A0AA49Q785_9BACT|nr:pyridoxal-dependent decarboxylase [Gemmatimonadaceae bacterium 'strain 138']WKW13830.1 pyridoxal-dependent decarboxylase [Gemmatimonadaceae bacterium 'strain 318']
MTDPRTAELLAALEADTRFEAGAQFLKIAADYFERTRAGEGPVSTRLDKREITARFDEPIPMGMQPLADVAARVERDVMPDIIQLMHPKYMGHQVSAPLAAAVWTDVVISAINQSQAVWEMSPVTTVIEERVIGWMCQLAGYGPGAAGTFTSGGTEATFTALLAARAAKYPDAWRTGWFGKQPPVLVHGEHAHYAVQRAAGAMGLGTDNCVAIGSTPEFKMDPALLAETLERLHRAGRDVLAVVATAGCTAVGAFDDLEAIADLCDKYGHWLHVDGAHGASALLSEKHKWRVKGIHRARSLAWDPHKMMLMPLSAGMVLVRDGKDLERAFAQSAPYLFHGADSEVELSPDLGKRSFQCSRRADALKVWVSLQRFGVRGIGALYAQLCDLSSRVAAEALESRLASVIHVPESNIICWRPATVDTSAIPDLVAALNEREIGWATSTVVGGTRTLRMTVMNPRTTPELALRAMQTDGT